MTLVIRCCNIYDHGALSGIVIFFEYVAYLESILSGMTHHKIIKIIGVSGVSDSLSTVFSE